VSTPAGQTALDAARAASRATTLPVLLVAPEPPGALPVPLDELHEAGQEGVTVRAGMGVRRIVGDGHVEGVVIAPIASLFDELGRFRPTLQEGHDETIAARTVIVAIGQESDLSFLPTSFGVAVAPWGGLRADRDGRTAHPRLFAAGDVSTGPRDLIDAIASGQRAARSIRADLSGADPSMPASFDGDTVATPMPPVVHPPVVHPQRSERRYYSGYDTLHRRVLPVLPPAARAQDHEVERLLAQVDARTEASRCLRCDTHIVLDASRCVACGLCVDVCPYGTLALIAQPLHGVGTFALTLDERACIRCGLCVDRCPAQALGLVHV
jgi:NAD-dependent dihydropyrimidine dehydrogenase PreA subunit